MKDRRRTVLWMGCAVLFFLAVFSFFSIDSSFSSYSKSKKDLSQANFEREQIAEMINSVEENTLRQQYTINHNEVAEKDGFKSIEIRGGMSSSEDNPYRPGTESFSVIEY